MTCGLWDELAADTRLGACEQNVQKALELLAQLDAWVDAIPPIQQPMRFGNRAFRDFYDRVIAVCAL